jgi:hypothetical protein
MGCLDKRFNGKDVVAVPIALTNNKELYIIKSCTGYIKRGKYRGERNDRQTEI